MKNLNELSKRIDVLLFANKTHNCDENLVEINNTLTAMLGELDEMTKKVDECYEGSLYIGDLPVDFSSKTDMIEARIDMIRRIKIEIQKLIDKINGDEK